MLSGLGGIGSLSYSSSSGSINPATGEFMGLCEENVGLTTVSVEDERGNYAQINVPYSCAYRSCNEILAEGIGTASGNYWIDPDGTPGGIAPFKGYCDQTTDQGGWLRVVDSSFTNQEQIDTLAMIGSYDSISSSYSRVASGITWGDRNETYAVYGIKSAITIGKARITYSGTYTGGGLGYFIVTPGMTNGTMLGQPIVSPLLVLSDAWGDDNGGQTLSVNGSSVFTQSKTAVTDRTDVLIGEARRYGMTGYTTSYPYSRRYIKTLLVKENYYKLPVSCNDAKIKGAKNTLNTTGNGTYSIDPDGFGFGNAPYNVVCDMMTDSFGWQEVPVGNYSATKMLAGKQFVKLVTDQGATGVGSGTQVLGLWKPNAPTTNMLQGKPTLLTTNNYVTHSTPVRGYNYVGAHNWFANNGVDINTEPYPNIVFFGNGVAGLVSNSSNGSASISEHSYIYYRRYTYTLWERP